MKRLSMSLLSVFMTLYLFSSCSDEDADLVGRWTRVSITVVDVKTSSTKADDIIREKFGLKLDDITRSIVELTSDGKVYLDGEEDGTYSISGNEITFTKQEGGEDQISSYYYSIEGNTLFLWFDIKDDVERLRNTIGITEDVTIDKVILKTILVRNK